jgi:twitching motility two-component system response regulator PilG
VELRESFDRCPLCGGIQVFFDPRLTDDARLSERTDHSQILGAVNRITLNLRTSPESSELHYALALAYLNLGRVSTAVESLRRSQKFGPRPALEQEIARLLSPPEGNVVPPPVASESRTAPEGAVPDASENSGELPSTGKVVLVAEESAVLRKLIAGALEKEGYTVVTVADGVEALERFNESTLDMVLLDAAMPQMDGYQVCRSIRTATKELPILLLSARDGFFDKVRGRVAGCTAYVTKPFLREDLITTVRQHCPLNTPQETFQS